MSWKEFKLDDLIKIKHGYAFKGEYFSDETTTDILVTPGNFLIGGGFKHDKLKYYKGPILKDYILKKNDIIVTMTDLSKQADTLGFSARVPAIDNCTLLHNQRIGLLQLKDIDFDLDFIYWLMRTEEYQKFVAGSATGSTVKHTSPTKICAYKFYAPSNISTQKHIASILSVYDDLIENNLKRIKLLEELSQRTYEEWFVKYRIHGEQLEVGENGLPDGWERKKFKETLVFKTGKLDSNAMVDNGSFDFYTCSKEIYKTNTYCFEGEAILLGGNNATGNFSLFYANSKFDAYQRTYIVTSKSNEIPLVYVYYVLKNLLPQFQNVSSGAATKFLTMRILDATEIIIPNEKYLINYLKIVKPMFDKIINLQNQNRLLKESRDILLPRLMSEKIGVGEIEKARNESLKMVAEPREAYSKE